MKRSIVMTAAGLVVITLLISALYFYSDWNIRQIRMQQMPAEEYERHYCLISTDRSSFWQGVYENAAVTGKDSGSYLEWIGMASPADYSLQDCLRIAIASDVDGIILYPGNEGEDKGTVALIDEAVDEGIPVLTVITDAPDSSRIGYVGVNNYQMGELYGTQLLKTLHDGLNRICMLSNAGSDNASVNLVYSRMLQVLEESKKSGQSVEVVVKTISTATGFDAEEEIRDIFVTRDSLPDTLVCMDLTATESAAQALVDYNRVGSVNVIGTYLSSTVLEAVDKGIITAAAGLDESGIGQVCVSALDEYNSLGYASNYINIPLETVTQENVKMYEGGFLR